jgi:hypothetical protein
MGPWLPADFNLAAFKIFAGTAGSAEWLTVEHPVVFVVGVLILMERILRWKP